MKNIKIAHIYYDLLNLYGENGNIRALVKKIEEQKVKVHVTYVSLADEIDFSAYDLFYIGSGTEKNLLLALEHLLPYQEEIKKAVNDGKFFLITGNALEIFGNSYQTLDLKTYAGLEIFHYDAKEIDTRIVGEQLYTSSLIAQKIIGFQNRAGILKHVEEHNLFTIIDGMGYTSQNESEGVWKNHAYATYLLGPLCIRNPYFTDYLIEELFAYKNISMTKVHKGIEYQAYLEYLKNFDKTKK